MTSFQFFQVFHASLCPSRHVGYMKNEPWSKVHQEKKIKIKKGVEI